MKKLVLAISSVFCLQLGFIAYNASDPAADTSFVVIDENSNRSYLATFVAEPFTEDRLVSDIPVDPIVDLPLATKAAASVAVKPEYVRAVSSFRSRTSRQKRRDLNTFVSHENPASLRPVRVTYKVHNGVEFKQFEPSPKRTEYPSTHPSRGLETFETSAKLTVRPKKKNLFAKVIRKPYDWLKAIGSAFK